MLPRVFPRESKISELPETVPSRSPWTLCMIENITHDHAIVRKNGNVTMRYDVPFERVSTARSRPGSCRRAEDAKQAVEQPRMHRHTHEQIPQSLPCIQQSFVKEAATPPECCLDAGSPAHTGQPCRPKRLPLPVPFALVSKQGLLSQKGAFSICHPT